LAGEYTAAPKPTTAQAISGMHAEEDQAAAENLDQVGDEHHASLGHRIGKGADESGQQDVEQDERQLQQRGERSRGFHRRQQTDRDKYQRVVCQRRKELRRHDGIKTTIHSRGSKNSVGCFIP
jgi:hypothetical protein